MNATLCFISPEMKCTSRDSRSSLATMTGGGSDISGIGAGKCCDKISDVARAMLTAFVPKK
jgi:hypothetical protein